MSPEQEVPALNSMGHFLGYKIGNSWLLSFSGKVTLRFPFPENKCAEVPVKDWGEGLEPKETPGL